MTASSTLAGVFLKGTAAARPAANAVAGGAVYSATDTGVISQSDGSSWSTWATISSGMANPMTTSQDLIVGGASGTPGRLAAGAAGAALSMINSAVAWNSGTSFPGSKATGDRYWRTDLGLEFYWDGTRWLSTTLYKQDFYLSELMNRLTTPSAGWTTTAAEIGWAAAPFGAAYDTYVVDLRLTTRVTTQNTGSHYWGLYFYKQTTALSPTQLGSTVTTAADTVSLPSWHTAAINAVVATTTTNPSFQLSANKDVGSPGALYVAGGFTYRLIGV